MFYLRVAGDTVDTVGVLDGKRKVLSSTLSDRVKGALVQTKGLVLGICML